MMLKLMSTWGFCQHLQGDHTLMCGLQLAGRRSQPQSYTIGHIITGHVTPCDLSYYCRPCDTLQLLTNNPSFQISTPNYMDLHAALTGVIKMPSVKCSSCINPVISLKLAGYYEANNCAS